MHHGDGGADDNGGRNAQYRQRSPLMLQQFDLFVHFLRSRFSHGERGASLVEYALLVALIAVVCIGAVSFIGNGASGTLSSAGSQL
jgi:pilus assembly protein Flp/PilA